MANAQSIVRLQTHANRTPTGRASATAARKLVQYLAYGRGRPAEQARRLQRGVWYGENGRSFNHDQVMGWVAQQGKANHYTHQLILSVKEAHLSPAAYGQALQVEGAPFAEWRLVVHQDTDHPHAHVIAFSDAEIRVTGRDFRHWWLAARQELEKQQHLITQQRDLAPQQRAQTTQLETPLPKQQQQAAVREWTRQWEMEL